MAINPRVAARREAEIAFLKEEDERLKDLGEKRKKEAAEKSAATKKEDLPGYDPNKEDEEFVFYSEDDKEEENDYSTFGNDFLESLDEDEPKYLSPAERRKQKTSDSMFNTYNTGEEWLMSDEGGDDLAKGFINNFRSAIGTGVEDFAFWLTENAPWYKPAQNVVGKNTAGKVEEQAQKQFGNAKANGVNGNVVDFLDNTSKNLGYSLFGFKAGDYVQSIGEGFDIYRKLREQGYGIEEATNKSLISAGASLAGEKVLDKGGKWLNKQLPKGNVYGLTAGTDEFVDRVDDILPELPKKSTITERIEKGEISTKIISGKQNKHIEGTKQYKDKYKDGANPQDVLTISMEEAQELVDRYCGKGDPGKSDMNGTWTEFMDADHVIGKYYSNGEYHETKRFTIHYSKKGAHVIPVRPKEAMKK